MKATDRLKSILADSAVRHALTIFVTARIFLSVWAVVALTLNPLPTEPDERLRPYLGEFPVTWGAAGLLLGPWQRFDTLHYMRIARHGYSAPYDSVFPPLYPLAIRGLGTLLVHSLRLRGSSDQMSAVSYLLAGLILSNLACLGSLILLYQIAAAEVDSASAIRTLVYIVLFPTGFFLFAAYTESLFLLLALGSFWSARRGRLWAAGALGLLASVTRLTGWILFVPLAYEYLHQRDFNLRRLNWTAIASLLPSLGPVSFLCWRWWVGLPPLGEVYRHYWLRTPGFPGADLLIAVSTALSGEASFTLFFDFFSTSLLLITTIAAFRWLGVTYGLYSTMMLFFILLPNSNSVPLYSVSRFALTFFPTFMVLGLAGRRPWVNRLILYPSLALFLYFSGQFFVWGWVA
jgi:hypothetical protein